MTKLGSEINTIGALTDLAKELDLYTHMLDFLSGFNSYVYSPGNMLWKNIESTELKRRYFERCSFDEQHLR
jgi:hypothetical protein